MQHYLVSASFKLPHIDGVATGEFSLICNTFLSRIEIVKYIEKECQGATKITVLGITRMSDEEYKIYHSLT